MTVLYTNNAATTLAATISNTATSMSVASGTGSLFPTVEANQFFFLTLIDSGGSLEIVKVTGRTDDTLTIERAQDGTTALAFAAGSKVELRITKGMLDQLKLDAAGGGLTGETLDYDSNANTGASVRLGFGTTADGAGVAVGWNAAAAANGTALGSEAVASNILATAIGAHAVANYMSATALGGWAEAKAEFAIAVNGMVKPGADGGVAVGGVVHDNALHGVTIGGDAVAAASIAVGYGAVGYAINAIALGTNAIASGENAVAIGKGSEVHGGAGYGIAIGFNAVVDYNATNSIVIGNGASTAALNTLVINPDPDSGVISPTHPGVYIGGIKDPTATHNNIGILKYDIDTKEVYYFPEEPTTPALLGSTTPEATALGSGATTTDVLSISIGNSTAVRESTVIGYNNIPATQSTLIGSLLDTSAVTERITVIGSNFPFPFTQGGLYFSDIRDDSHSQSAFGKRAVYYDEATREIYHTAFNAPAVDTHDGTCAVGELATSVFASVAVGGQAGAQALGGIAIGYGASSSTQTGKDTSGTYDTYSIAIGMASSAGKNSVLVGGWTQAASFENITTVGNNIIIGSNNIVALNGSQDIFQVSSPGFYVQPMRGTTGVDRSWWGGTAYTLKYYPGYGEIFYDEAGGSLTGFTNDNTGLGINAVVDPGIMSAIAIGQLASVIGTAGNNSIAMGTSATVTNAETAIAIGYGALTSAESAIALGKSTIASCLDGIAIGNLANVQPGITGKSGGIAIGKSAKAEDNSIVIGQYSNAGYGDAIVLNTTGTEASPFATFYSGFYVKPIRDNTQGQTSTGTLQYDSNTGEIFYGAALIASTLFEGNSAFGFMATAGASGSTAFDANFCTAIGSQSSASGVATTALGYNTTATGDYAVAIGHNSHATGLRSIAIGWAEVSGANSIYISSEDFMATLPINAENSISIQGRATGDYGIAMGMNARAPGYSVAIGGSSNGGSGTYTVVIGQGATVEGDGAIAIGASILSSGTNSVAIGRNVNSISDGGIAIGYAAQVSGPSGVAIGNNASASEGIAIGTVVAEATGLFVKPVRDNTHSQTSAGFLQYDSTTGEVFYGPAYAYYNSNTTNALDYTNGSVQRWAPSTGAQTLSITNWPPSGNLGELMIEGVNLGAATITWPAAINWVKSNGSTTTTFSSSGVTLQTSGTDFVVLWTRDAGTTIYGKVVR